MKNLLFLAICVCCTSAVYSTQVPHVETIITLQNEKGAYSSVVCGVDTGATQGIDATLGEFAIPGFPPQPAGLQSALVFRDHGSPVLSYRDYRKLDQVRIFTDTFTLMVTPATDISRGETVFFRWAYPLDRNIDSIIISDLFGGVIKRIFLDNREADTLSGNATNLENFQIIVHYNIKDIVGVEDEDSNSLSARQATSLFVHDNVIRVPEGLLESCGATTAHLYSLQGQEIASWGASGDKRLDGLSTGYYMLTLCDESGVVLSRLHVMKQ